MTVTDHPEAVEIDDVSDDLVIPHEVCEMFLEILASNPGVGHVAALRDLGIQGTRRQIKDAIDRQLRVDIERVRNDAIRTALYRRGIDGTLEDVWHNGEVVGQKLVYSDRCLIALAGMKLPEARNQLDVNLAGADGGPVRVEVEGDRVSTVRGVLALAASLGVAGASDRLDAAAPRRALPAAEVVLPDPPDDQ